MNASMQSVSAAYARIKALTKQLEELSSDVTANASAIEAVQQELSKYKADMATCANFDDVYACNLAVSDSANFANGATVTGKDLNVTANITTDGNVTAGPNGQVKGFNVVATQEVSAPKVYAAECIQTPNAVVSENLTAQDINTEVATATTLNVSCVANLNGQVNVYGDMTFTKDNGSSLLAGDYLEVKAKNVTSEEATFESEMVNKCLQVCGAAEFNTMNVTGAATFEAPATMEKPVLVSPVIKDIKGPVTSATALGLDIDGNVQIVNMTGGGSGGGVASAVEVTDGSSCLLIANEDGFSVVDNYPIAIGGATLKGNGDTLTLSGNVSSTGANYVSIGDTGTVIKNYADKCGLAVENGVLSIGTNSVLKNTAGTALTVEFNGTDKITVGESVTINADATVNSLTANSLTATSLNIETAEVTDRLTANSIVAQNSVIEVNETVCGTLSTVCLDVTDTATTVNLTAGNGTIACLASTNLNANTVCSCTTCVCDKLYLESMSCIVTKDAPGAITCNGLTYDAIITCQQEWDAFFTANSHCECSGCCVRLLINTPANCVLVEDGSKCFNCFCSCKLTLDGIDWTVNHLNGPYFESPIRCKCNTQISLNCICFCGNVQGYNTKLSTASSNKKFDLYVNGMNVWYCGNTYSQYGYHTTCAISLESATASSLHTCLVGDSMYAGASGFYTPKVEQSCLEVCSNITCCGLSVFRIAKYVEDSCITIRLQNSCGSGVYLGYDDPGMYFSCFTTTGCNRYSGCLELKCNMDLGVRGCCIVWCSMNS